MNITHNGKTMTDIPYTIYRLLSTGHYAGVEVNIFIKEDSIYFWTTEEDECFILTSPKILNEYNEWLDNSPLLRELL